MLKMAQFKSMWVISYLGYPGFVFQNITFLRSLSLFLHSLIFGVTTVLTVVSSVPTVFSEIHYIPESKGGILLPIFLSVATWVTKQEWGRFQMPFSLQTFNHN